jgi:hypothetical protein
MNIEICKKCPKLKNKQASFYLHEDILDFIPVIVDNDTTFHEWICQMKTINRNNIKFIDANNKIPFVEFKDVKVYPDCLFFVEHELNDYNEERN